MGKIFMRISIVSIIIGFVLLIVSITGLKGNFSEVFALYNEDSTFTEKNFSTTTSNHKNLIIDTMNRSIVFEISTSDEFSISYYDSDIDYLVINEDDNSLTITNEVKNQITYFPRWVSSDRRIIMVSLPKNFKTNIDITSINGNVDISGVLELNNIRVTTSNGNLTMADMGQIINLEFITTNGSSNIGNASIKSIKVSSTNGSHKLLNIVSERVVANTTNGSIRIDIKGIPKQYRIVTSTIHGKTSFNDINLANGSHQTDGIYLINTKTTNGSIHISIEN